MVEGTPRLHGNLTLKGHALLRGGGTEQLHGLADQGAQIARARGDTELPSLDTDDVHEVADEPVHPGDVELDALRAGRDLPPVLGVRCRPPEDHRIDGDPGKEVAQVVGHDPEEVVPVRERVVEPRSLRHEVPVGSLALEREEQREGTGVLQALIAERLVSRRSRPLQRLVLDRPLRDESVASGSRFRGLVQLPVRLDAGRAEDRVCSPAPCSTTTFAISSAARVAAGKFCRSTRRLSSVC